METSNRDLKIEENVPLAPLTSLKVGGAARFFVRAESEGDVLQAVRFAAEHDFPLFILGGGSNVLIADRGFHGLVLQVAARGVSFAAEGGESVLVTANAGEDWDEFVAICVDKALAGLECLSGIPGYVGGTPIQNVGAYGQEVSETIVKVRAFDRKSAEVLELSGADCRFAYRSSVFNTTERERFIVLAVTYRLKKNGAPKISYKDLREYFGDRQPTLAETREAVRRIRAEKAMLVRQGGRDAQSAGSFFKNPVVTKAKFAEIAEIARTLDLNNVPSFLADGDRMKVPAAWLIEKSGFYKGYEKGRARISTRHTLAIVNGGGATARELIALKDEIQAKVREKFGVELQPEPVFVGF